MLVTGPSGAGRSTAINVLEDLGFESIDNLPLNLLPRLLDGPPLERPLALGLDVRNRDFEVNAVLDTIRRLAADPEIDSEVLYLDCTQEVLLRRFSETRRRHPMSPGDAPGVGIVREIELLAPIRHQATVLLDTSELSPHELRAALQEWYDPEPARRLAISVQSFSYKRGVPRGVDLVFDCRFLRNPYWEPALRARDGRDSGVAGYVAADPLCAPFFDKVADMVLLLLPAFQAEGKSHLTIGFGCTGGKHRSVMMTEKLGKALANQGWQASIRHRELERHARSVPPQAGVSL
ncbi:ATP-binding protein ManX [Candidatus Rhodobacter oscarellae]|uniref:ATP-binding protein ManX n=1 Tax=Candidatus Rhodobacter oscarellae TaxID=1675527 RepID=A0A0J9H4J0_9RHOB|nr:ATP-binding protein ManX [Candidatus Rhodobacter lobularis]